MQKPSTDIPAGYRENAQGALVPEERVTDIDKLRDDLVRELVTSAQALQQLMRKFKLDAMSDIAAFLELSAERYEVNFGGKKGNLTLTSYDGRFKVQRAVAEHLTFDERLQVAKELIDRCIHRWAAGSAAEIRALVEHAFQVDSEGKISTGRVLGLRRLDIKDAEWQQAMTAIADSIQVTGSKVYLRLYERVGDADQWRPIALDMAAL
ncbi:sulfate transporter [Zobellella denitrificans]|uniref:Sulfate transporter n=1 Tax=Zobellella denitrificans TaxID=347534 RepID=A0A291HNG0_9GAMM|nr:DUF3164 family protein [Zobellella denitrificans]ATG73649.1 sulfate transporter [Zobellella denitrificans]